MDLPAAKKLDAFDHARPTYAYNKDGAAHVFPNVSDLFNLMNAGHAQMDWCYVCFLDHPQPANSDWLA